MLELSASISDLKELEKLKGIGPGIRSKIERRLAVDGRRLLNPMPDSIVQTDEHYLSTLVIDKSQPEASKRRKVTKTKPKTEYIPRRRSGPYAMLIALHLDSLDINSKGYLTKGEIIQRGQPYCTSAMDEGTISPIQGAIKILTAKGLVNKVSIPARFSLTDAGIDLAERLWNMGEAFMIAKTDQGDLVTAETRFTTIESVENDGIVLNSSPEVHFENFCLRKGEYDIVLLVDTREIKSRDERNYIVNKLDEAGVQCEQRSLELGDFLWIAQSKTNAADEIVLDYVIERKIESDLIQSIIDRRFTEQKVLL